MRSKNYPNGFRNCKQINKVKPELQTLRQHNEKVLQEKNTRTAQLEAEQTHLIEESETKDDI